MRKIMFFDEMEVAYGIDHALGFFLTLSEDEAVFAELEEFSIFQTNRISNFKEDIIEAATGFIAPPQEVFDAIAAVPFDIPLIVVFKDNERLELLNFGDYFNFASQKKTGYKIIDAFDNLIIEC